jgi:hypothetical protein
MTAIQIIPAPPTLTKYTHAVDPHAAQDLATRITELEASGYTVTHAVSTRNTVPTCYRSAHKMVAPCYVFNANTRSVTLTPAKLETRPRGRAIPPHIHIEGATTPPGYRALKKSENSIDLIPA